MAEKLPHGAFVFTSNVDGHFQKAGFSADRLWECHGSVHYLQCLEGCLRNVWQAKDFSPDVDDEHCLLINDAPSCPHCGALARPNILMFGDWEWVDDRERLQAARYQYWRSMVQRSVVIEIGAGTAIPSVRRFGEGQKDGFLIRINPTEPAIGMSRGIGFSLSGHEALKGITMALIERGWRTA
jgi:NAD-dependent SIR2 family protein deacetylase